MIGIKRNHQELDALFFTLYKSYLILDKTKYNNDNSKLEPEEFQIYMSHFNTIFN